MSMELPKIGFGCKQLGLQKVGEIDEKEVIKSAHRAIELGINLFDTAPIYGLGYSEWLLGGIIKDKRKDLIIATKTGLSWEVYPKYWKYIDNSAEKINKDLETSLRRFDTDYIDILLLHYPDFLTPIDDSINEMLKLKQAGKVREIGYCNVPLCMLKEALKYSNMMVQVAYNVNNREVESDLLPYCYSHNIPVMAHSVLDNGRLRDKAQTAIQWVASNPAITTVLVGIKNTEQIEQVMEYVYAKSIKKTTSI